MAKESPKEKDENGIPKDWKRILAEELDNPSSTLPEF